jgi:tetratricopeptide (TPR) repeat protein
VSALARLVLTVAILALVGLNAWWLVRDAWPAPEMSQVKILFARRQFGEAESALREILRRSPHHGEARMLLARVLLLKGDRLGGAAELHEVPSWWPAKRDAAFAEGQAYRDAGRNRQAEEAWKLCIADDVFHPMNPEYLAGAAEGLLGLYAAEGRWDEARAVLWEIYAQLGASARPKVLNKWLQTVFWRIDPKEPSQMLRRAVAADPDDWGAHLGLARVAEAVRDAATADRHRRECIRIRPDDPRAWRDRLASLWARGDLDGLRRAWAEAPAVVRADAEVLGYHGRALQAAGDLKGAAEALGTASAWRPFDDELAYSLSQVERRLGRSAEADDHLRLSKRIKDARMQLPAAGEAFRRAAAGQAEPGAPDQATSAARLAELCETLGWRQAADAWRSLTQAH